MHGPLDRIVCSSCFGSISRRLRSSIYRRWIYAGLGLTLGPAMLYTGYIRANDPTMALFGLVCIVAGSVNLVRIKNYRDALRSRPYSNVAPEKTTGS